MTPWQLHLAKWQDCQRCALAQQRGRICLARGAVPADVVFVGEAPGESEDTLGLPFKGPAGRLLDSIIAQSVPAGVSYAITNLVACFPAEAKKTDKHEPAREEIAACAPRLREFVEVCGARLIAMVGSLADDYVPSAFPDATFYAGGGITGHPTLLRYTSIVHPASILRMPMAQRDMAVRRSIVTIASAVQSLEGKV